jgi:hypothetical protein
VEKDCEANNEVNYQLINFSGHHFPIYFPEGRKPRDHLLLKREY